MNAKQEWKVRRAIHIATEAFFDDRFSNWAIAWCESKNPKAARSKDVANKIWDYIDNIDANAGFVSEFSSIAKVAAHLATEYGYGR